jgi:segregation and condensation protein A
VATFIAVLELCRARRVRLAGTQTDCTVTCTQEGEDLENLAGDLSLE